MRILLVVALMALVTWATQPTPDAGFYAEHYAQAEAAIADKPNARIVIDGTTYSTDERGWLWMQGADDDAPIPVDFRFRYGDT
jgi:hypothetical protein